MLRTLYNHPHFNSCLQWAKNGRPRYINIRDISCGGLPIVNIIFAQKSGMEIYDFMDLNKNERAEAVWQGTFLSDGVRGEHRIQLYRLHSFYVEVFYNQASNQIERFHPFKSLHKLVPYLEQNDSETTGRI